MVELSLHLKEICKKELFWLEYCKKGVRGYRWVPGGEERHKLHGVMKFRPEYIKPRVGKDRVCFLYNEMSICPEVSQICTPCCWDDLRYSSISICPCQLPDTKLNGIGGANRFSCHYGLQVHLCVLNWRLQGSSDYSQVPYFL